MGFFAAYLMAVGGFTAGVQVVRGVVRGAGKLIEGEPRTALAEMAGGMVAPLFSAYVQVCQLGEDVWRSVGALTESGDEERKEIPGRPAPQPGCRSFAGAAPAVNGR
jgi:hypothetical protein